MPSADRQVDRNPSLMDRLKPPKKLVEIASHFPFTISTSPAWILAAGITAGAITVDRWNIYQNNHNTFTPTRIAAAEKQYQGFFENLADRVRAGEFGDDLRQDLQLLDNEKRLKLAHQRYDQLQQEIATNITEGRLGSSMQEAQSVIANKPIGSQRLGQITAIGGLAIFSALITSIGIAIPLGELYFWRRKSRRKANTVTSTLAA